MDPRGEIRAMPVTKLKLGCSALALAGAALPCMPVLAQDTEFGADGLGGFVRDDLDPNEGDAFSGGVLPSVQLRGSGIVGQADGMLFEHNSDTGLGGALHIGAALGEAGFVGIYGSISELDRAGGLTTSRIGGEIKLTSGEFWFSGVAGHEDAEEAIVYVRTTATDDVYDVYGEGSSFFAFADAGWSPSATTAVSVGYRRTGGRDAAAATAAIGVTPALSVLFQGRAGANSYKGVFAGLRLRFGGPVYPGPRKLLENRLIEDLFTAGNGRRQLLDPLPPPPPPEEEEQCGSCGGYCDD